MLDQEAMMELFNHTLKHGRKLDSFKNQSRIDTQQDGSMVTIPEVEAG